MARIILTNLKLVNFKSYAGEHVLGPFKSSFSCILGANGSGKSNVIDSLLFVFGWRARALRHSRLVDLIHTSSEHPDLDHARVDVHFMLWDDDQHAAVPGSDFTISRVIRRKNSDSYYEINGMRATQADIITFMRERGMDLSSHRFLILQGEIEQISLMKPRNAESLLDLQTEAFLKHLRDGSQGSPNLESITPTGDGGLLEFLENIVGTQKYVPTIARLAAETQLLEETRSQMRTRLRTAVAYRDELEEQHAAVVDSLKSIVEGTKLCARYFQVQVFSLRKLMSAGCIEQQQLREQSEQLMVEKISPIDAEISSTETVIEQINDRLKELMSTEKGCIERIRELEVEKTVTGEKLELHISWVAKFDGEIASQEASIQQYQAEIKAFPAQEQALRQEIADLENIISELSDKLFKASTTQPDKKGAAEELETISQNIVPLRKQLIGVTARLSSIRQSGLATATALVELCCNIILWILLIGSSFKSLKKSLKTYVNSLHLIASMDEKLQEYQQIQNRSRLLLADKAQLQATLTDLQERLKAIDASRDTLKEQTETEKMLLDAQAKGLLKGIHGRIGNLASVSSQDINMAALSAFGGSLNTIVVDSMENIELALRLLREQRRGVTNFLDLSRVSDQYRKHLAGQFKLNVPQGTVLFLDQLHVKDEIYRPALWHVVRDTLLCDDMNLANKLTSGRGATQRVVTYDGDVFDPSGVISGGGDKTKMLKSGRGFALSVGSSGSRGGDNDETHRRKLKHDISSEIDSIQKKLIALNNEIEMCKKVLAQATLPEEAATKSAIMVRITGFQDEFSRVRDLVFRALSSLRSSFSSSILAKFSIEINALIRKDVSDLYHALEEYDSSGGEDVENVLHNLMESCPTLLNIYEGILSDLPDVAQALLGASVSTHARSLKDSALISTLSVGLFGDIFSRGDMSNRDTTDVLDQCADVFMTHSAPSNIFVFQSDIRQVIFLGDQEMQLRAEEQRFSNEIQALEALVRKIENGQTDSDQAEIKKDLNIHSEKHKELTKALQEATLNQKKLEPRISRARKQITELHSNKQRFQTEINDYRHKLQELAKQQEKLTSIELPHIQSEIAKIKDQIKETKSRHSSYISQREELLKELHDLKQSIQAIEQTIQGKEMECKRHAAKYTEHLHLLDKLFVALQLTVFDFDELGIALNPQSVEVLTNQQNTDLVQELCMFPQRELDSQEVADSVLELYGNIKVDKKASKSLETGLDLDTSTTVLIEYRTRAKVVFERQAEFQALAVSYDAKKADLNAKRDQRASEFIAAFTLINTYLRDIYKTLTLGGDAQLEFINQFDPFDGVLFSVMPPRKSWKQICNLSGGEKTLSSLSLIFALHCYKPTPLYVMDEIDAALDFRNVSIIAKYIKGRTKNAQFVVISLRNNTFELADRLIGIYKQDNCSRCIICDPDTILTKIKASE